MLYVFIGTDRQKAREALNAEIKKHSGNPPAGGTLVVRITDASSLEDLRAALGGSGMFAEKRLIVLDGTFANEEMRAAVESELPRIAKSEELFLLLEEKLDAATRKTLEKYAESAKRFDLPAKARDGSIFAIANALRKGDKKGLWVSLQREFAKGAAPEAIHGVLFWGAKDMFMKARGEGEKSRAKKIIESLVELPHEARRHGEELEYALERFVLSGA